MKEVNKYFIFDSTDENEELLKKYNDVWNGMKNEIKTTNGGKQSLYQQDYIKTQFNSDDDLPLNKQLKFQNMALTTRSIFEEDGKFYPQVFLDDTLYELSI